MSDTQKGFIKRPGHSVKAGGSWVALAVLLVCAMTGQAQTASDSGAGTTGGFKYFVGIVGNPSVPDISWSDEQLEQIKALGVNMVQLSIAWGGKPANEVLNLEDLDKEQREKFAFRIKQAKKHGLKTIAHFGIPRMLNYSPVRPACILARRSRRNIRSCWAIS
jgi:hypothetical protein